MFRKAKRVKTANVFNAKIGRTRKEKYRPLATDTRSTPTSSTSSKPTITNYYSYTRSRSSNSSSDSVLPDQEESNANEAKANHAVSRYASDKRCRLEHWQKLRPSLVQTFYSGESPQSFICQCGSISGLYRCLDCSEWESICLNCLQERHQQPHLHKFEAWKELAFIGFTTDTPIWKTDCKNCNSHYCKEVKIVDEKGRQHKRTIQFCTCEDEAVTLIKFHLWPSTSKKPTLAFHFEFMKWMYGLFVEGHLSVKAFCESLKARATKHDRPYVTLEVSDIYKALMTETFEEFCSFLYAVEHPFYEDGTSCPACYKSSRRLYSFDADFQLVRKKSAGQEWGPSNYAGHFFLNQKDIDSFMDNYTSDKSKPIQDCSEFQAGNNLRSKSKYHKLDETALFGSTCQHGHPKYFFNLKHGERLGYAVFLLRCLVEEHQSSKSEQPLFIMYDIACSLKNHLTKQKDNDILEKISLSIPIFHSYGHKVSCQVLYGPRRQEGLGFVDGESCERLWSYLGRFSNITKESTTENRVNRLTCALLHFSRKLKDSLGTYLPEKLNKAIDLQSTSTKSLEELLQPFPAVKEEDILAWMHDEVAQSNEPQIKRNTMTCQGEEARREVLKSMYKLVSERIFLLNLMKKYARGQAVANRVSKQIRAVNHKIQNDLKKYNNIIGMKKHLPLTLTFDEVKLNTMEIWSMVEFGMNFVQCVPPISIRQQAVELFNMIQRCKEEVKYVREEMLCTLDYYKRHMKLLEDSCSSGLLSNGMKAYAVKEGLFIELKVEDLYKKFSKYIELEEPDHAFKNLLQISTMIPLQFTAEEYEDDENDFDSSLESDCEV